MVTFASDIEMTEQETCIMILRNRIRDIRRQERTLIDSNTPYDELKIRKKIGGLKKCIGYIQNH